MSIVMMKSTGLVLGTVAVLALSACQGLNMGRHAHAQADMHARSASQVQGQVAFKKANQGLRVSVQLTGLTPNQAHAKDLSLDNGALTDIKGRSVVVHERADDYHSQPAGNAGKRIACGVIKKV